MASTTLTGQEAVFAAQLHARRQRAVLTRRIAFYALVIALAVFCLFPFYWAVVSSFKGDLELFQRPPTLFPHSPTWANYNDVIFHRQV